MAKCVLSIVLALIIFQSSSEACVAIFGESRQGLSVERTGSSVGRFFDIEKIGRPGFELDIEDKRTLQRLQAIFENPPLLGEKSIKKKYLEGYLDLLYFTLEFAKTRLRSKNVSPNKLVGMLAKALLFSERVITNYRTDIRTSWPLKLLVDRIADVFEWQMGNSSRGRRSVIARWNLTAEEWVLIANYDTALGKMSRIFDANYFLQPDELPKSAKRSAREIERNRITVHATEDPLDGLTIREIRASLKEKIEKEGGSVRFSGFLGSARGGGVDHIKAMVDQFVAYLIQSGMKPSLKVKVRGRLLAIHEENMRILELLKPSSDAVLKVNKFILISEKVKRDHHSIHVDSWPPGTHQILTFDLGPVTIVPDFQSYSFVWSPNGGKCIIATDPAFSGYGVSAQGTEWSAWHGVPLLDRFGFAMMYQWQ